MIIKLSEETISKISSGETVSSPSTIIKELLENSLDAGSSEITIELKNDLSLSIDDNGTGIKEEDLPLLCARYCTSKLQNIDDLNNISTYGFRGEALASISLCSDLYVKSGNYECIYKENELISKKRVAYKNGCYFNISNIFYNNISRREYFYKRKEELRKMIDLVFYYKIISNVKINLLLNSKSIDKFCINSINIPDKCKAIQNYHFIEESLLYNESENILLIFSPPALHLNKSIIKIFLNKRLIANNRVKLELINLYKSILPTDKYPLIFLGIKFPQEQVDINIHPSKQEAMFDEIFVIKEAIKMIKEGLNDSDMHIPLKNNYEKIVQKSEKSENFNNTQKIYENEQDSLFSKFYLRKREFKLQSIKILKEEIISNSSIDLNKLIYVGIDRNGCYCQLSDKLMKFNIHKLIYLFFKQILILEFGDFDKEYTDYELNEEINEEKIEFLNYYFFIKIKDNKIKEAPSKLGIKLNDDQLNTFVKLVNEIEFNDELEVFKLILNKLALLFAESTKMNEIFFDVMKKRIISNNEIIECFYEVTTLNKLYKLFDRV
ncbi:hypothetical protein H312_00285 [Anncaliia algerae PRA339]|uniref:DNA mismatch repair protein S5 domain-containing protein n=1 Tax=Anncaliia algerae PRA339 TaxID=1288291 RepID=A0A059F578_9MICR|nr:hypothetical protein H312_00285 [Anncaliia algerae PRA339]